eukprot:m.70187 g.70187  ORF g.70187 m.70187 type:complete len:579 (+) comp12114_c0_seq3:183-1919(+)
MAQLVVREAAEAAAPAPASIVPETIFTAEKGESRVLKSEDVPQDSNLVLKDLKDCNFELGKLSCQGLILKGCSGCTITVEVGTEIASGTVKVSDCGTLDIKAATNIAKFEVTTAESMNVTFNNPDQLGIIKHKELKALSISFMNAKEYNVDLSEQTWNKYVKDALLVTRMYDDEIITTDIIEYEEFLNSKKILPSKLSLDKKEMLRKAKDALKDKRPEGVLHEITGKDGETITLNSAQLPEKPVVMLKNNSNTEIIIEDVSLVKLQMQGCRDCKLYLKETSKIVTGTVEIWECNEISFNTLIKVETLQVDIISGLKCNFLNKDCLGQIVQAGVDNLEVSFDTEPKLNAKLTKETLLAITPTYTPEDKFTQFITRIIEGELLTEEIIRLANDFPTTKREKLIHDRNLAAKNEALQSIASGMLNNVGDKLSDNDSKVLQDISDGSHAAQQAVETTLEERVEHKRQLGNEQFSLKNFQQAAVYYTEAIHIKDDIPSIWANRAMCWLKLSEPSKALNDADKCVELDPKYVKAHFRRGVALVAMERFREACQAFRTTLDLDPKNEAAKSSMILAERKLSQVQQ